MNKAERRIIAKLICEINSWRTPLRLRRILGRNLKHEEVAGAIAALEMFVPKTEWLEVWQEQDLGRTLRKKERGK